ncbi:hypothetical protein F4820DRAFT_197794 [Hypoxylon rubiginosum]|uniref:Uncharacterized protein n=1 Tax=Hypoxylon rubiginosum TaxID=110542 RepID=A0ACB9Z945_9PEZI|nr:hypothetical protein F4820DRAFT_197794 [Hypoxylon rubiginosum]
MIVKAESLYLDAIKQARSNFLKSLPAPIPIPHRYHEPDNLPEIIDNDDIAVREVLVRKLGSWVDSVQSGSPASRSPAPTIQSSDTTSTQPSTNYGFPLTLNDIYLVSDIPPRLKEIENKVKIPLQQGKNGFKEFTILKHMATTASEVFRNELDGAKEATYKTNIKASFVVNSSMFRITLMQLRQTELVPGRQSIRSCGNEKFNAEHYASFLKPEAIKMGHPDAIMALAYEWLSAFIDTIVPDKEFASIVSAKIRNKCDLCDIDIFFPHFISVFKCKQTLSSVVCQLRGYCAAALASGIPWIGHTNAIFGLAAHAITAKLFLAWMEPPDPHLHHSGPRYYMASIGLFQLDLQSDNERLQHILIHIHLWGYGDRRLGLEDELRDSVATEVSQLSARRDVALDGDENVSLPSPPTPS